MTDQFDGWRKLLKGEPVTIIDDVVLSGFYFTNAARSGGRVPVAIWRDGNGDLIARSGSKTSHKYLANDVIHERWPFIVGNPVSRADYMHAFETDAWPDGTPTTAPRDDNLSGDPLADLLAMARDRIETATAFLKGGPARDKTRADMARNIQAGLLAIKKKADALHEQMKRPHIDAGRAVDEQFRFRADLDVSAKALRTVFEAFAKAEEKRLKDEALAKFEAERKAAEADRARIAAEHEKLRRDDPIAAITSPAPALPHLPEGPAEVKVSVGGGVGRAAGLKTVWLPVIDDYRQTLDHFAEHPDVKAVVEKLVKAAVRTGKDQTKIPGVRIIEDRVSA